MSYQILSTKEAKEVFEKSINRYGKIADEVITDSQIKLSEHEYKKVRQLIVSIQNIHGIFNVDFADSRQNISSYLADKDFDGLYNFKKEIIVGADDYKELMDSVMKEGLEIRKESGFVYPKIFDDSQTVLVSIDEAKTSKMLREELLSEINEFLPNDKVSVVEKEKGKMFISYKGNEEKLHSFFSRRSKILGEVFSSAEKVDFEDKELFGIFSRKDFASVKELYKKRGREKNSTNQVLRKIFMDEVLFMHLSGKSAGSQEEFLELIKDTSVKYQKVADKALYASSKNVLDDENVKSADMIMLSIHPYNIATMSTYVDWKNCMTPNRPEFKDSKYDIGYGSIVAYLIDSENPQKRMSRTILKPLTSEEGNIIYQCYVEQGEKIEEFRQTLAAISEDLLSKRESGIYSLRPELQNFDTINFRQVIYKDIEELVRMSGMTYKTQEDGTYLVDDGELVLYGDGLKGEVDLSKFKAEFINFSLNDVTKVKLSEGYKMLYCEANWLEELSIHEGCEHVECSHNKLSKIDIPKGCKKVNCMENKLTQISIPEGCEEINCAMNKLTRIDVPENCKKVICAYNNISDMKIGKGCEVLICLKNNLTSLDVPEGCEYVNCGENPLEMSKVYIPPSVAKVDGLSKEQIKIARRNWFLRDNLDKNLIHASSHR